MHNGQADVEQGFIVNTDILQPNLKKETLVTMRLNHSSLASADFEVTPELIANL